MKKTRSLHLLAMLAIAPLSAQAAASARCNTAFATDLLPDAGADPLNANRGTYISDGNLGMAGGGTKAKTAIVGSSFSGVRKSDEINGGRSMGASEHDTGIGLGLALAAAGQQAYLR